MGYNYYILIQGINCEGSLVDLSYCNFSGSYSSSCNHYLYERSLQNYKINYDGVNEMGNIVTYYDLKI